MAISITHESISTTTLLIPIQEYNSTRISNNRINHPFSHPTSRTPSPSHPSSSLPAPSPAHSYYSSRCSYYTSP